MRKICAMAIIALFLFPLSINAQPNHIHIIYTFGKPDVEKEIVASHEYDVIHLNGDTAIFGKTGYPALPAAAARILIPYGMSVDEIVAKGEPVEMDGKYDVMPVEMPVPFGKSVIEKNASAYKSNEMYPGKMYDVVGVYYFRGFKILFMRLYPVQYVAEEGKILYYRSMEINVRLKNGGENHLFRGLKDDAIDVEKLVDNKNAISSYECNKDGKYDIMIITTRELKKPFDLLKKWHDEHEEPCFIATLDEIGKSAEDVRNYIRNAYLNLGIKYVLIGGDADVIPARELWVSGYDENTYYYETTMPSDLYYACLDGTFNYDNDDKWGEPNDGENGKDVDLIAEVYVGRACVNNIQEAYNFVEKTISYMNSNGSYLKKILLAGEYLGDYGVASWGGNYLDQLINSSDADGYYTAGIPSTRFKIEKLYDRDWEDNYWPAHEIIKRINSGVHIINHLGHSSADYNMRLTPDSMDELKNDEPCFIYSQGCYAGAFDYDDCMAEYFTKSKYGAFAGVWNARYGFFWSYSTDGDSQRYNRHFWDAVFGKEIYEIGRANQYSKEANLFIINRSMMRWCYYETNLFGDPAVKFHVNEPPAKPSRPSGVKEGKPGIEYTFSTTSYDIDGDRIYYKWEFGDGTNTTWIGPYESNETARVNHTWEKRGRYEVKVIAKDEHGMLSNWSDPLLVSMPAYPPLIQRLLEIISRFFDFLA